ncbi:curli production assembly/transport protein CsgG [Vibrio sp. ZSDE26]|uniref:Curli production assembly/transport component CsgG n=1 Tax=Vibrio amylolyticus TaxID=2847292 RepID=A0A9X1XKT7_9VIBR|nr:CsgG/HfaB family protein [Vibrio amylolyticus]MCK6264281.1 curli production assembly/transport protein CsgG [Vibrio amylolyticus]
MKGLVILVTVLSLAGCSNSLSVPEADEAPRLMPRGATYSDLIALPKPKGRILVSVYDFRDQTGQYKPSPNSNFSTAVPQGGTALLTTSLLDSNWFTPLEREGLQNLLTERKIIRAAQKKDQSVSNHGADLPSLSSANVVIEGGIVAYDSNVKTGGFGARYLGIGGATEYRSDMVTVNLRVVDVRTGQILLSVTTSKTILSMQVTGDVFRFVDYKDLLEVEAGYTNNEPVNVAVMSAIDASVIHLVIEGIERGMWQPANLEELNSPIIERYAKEQHHIL